jgi:hypothetical protein
MKTINESEVVQAIKEKELMTGKIGHFFITLTNGVMKTARVTIEHGGLLIADGKCVLDTHQVQFLSIK